MSECIYPCGWKNLKDLLVKESAYFAVGTLDDDYSESLRKAGIQLGVKARELADYAEKQQQRITELEKQLESISRERKFHVHELENIIEYVFSEHHKREADVFYERGCRVLRTKREG